MFHSFLIKTVIKNAGDIYTNNQAKENIQTIQIKWFVKSLFQAFVNQNLSKM